MSQAHGIPKHRQLPDKEARLFKELLAQYELKQYKKGIKVADTILKKFPNHGETIALKALTLHSSLPFPATASSAPKAEEAEAMARLAVKKDINSHITWHVLGILAKVRRDWDEAAKAFAMARRQDPDNIPVLRDAIALTTHTRQYQQSLDIRHHYLLLRPQIRGSWLGLMVAHELAGDIEEAVRVYDGFQSMVQKDGSTGPEKAQVLMHVIGLCMQSRHYENALERMEKGLKEGVISSRGEITQMKAKCLLELGRKDEAEEVYSSLLEQNADNLEFYRLFLRNRGLDISQDLDAENMTKVLKELAAFSEQYPRSSAPRRLALDVAKGEEFRALARDYIVRGLERGVPSLFVDVKGVYRDSARMAIVGEVIQEITEKLKAETSLHGNDTVPPPTTLLWAYYYLALHVVHPLHPNPNHAHALELINLALAHTPTLPELYMAKALVLKRAGDAGAAAEAMEEARLLDGQDRFLNGKAAKYWLRAGNVKKAEELLAMFTKKDVNAVADLTEMQCLWFLQEEGDAYKRSGDLALALKRYQSLVTVFQEYEDDQYDFHSYCMRRMTFNAYVALIKYEDQLRSHPAFFKTALSAIDIYIKVSDDPSVAVQKLSPEDEAERKKAAKKAQKAEQKARKAAVSTGEKKDEAPLPDADPRGEALIKSATPIDDALKLWAHLEKLHATRSETWLAGYELHVRKGQFLRALRDLREVAAIDQHAAGLTPALVDFRQRVASAELAAPVKAAIDEVLPSLIAQGPVDQLISADLGAHPASPEHYLAGARALKISNADPSEVTAALVHLGVPGRVPPSLPTMVSALDVVPEADRDMLREMFHSRLPLAFVFASAKEKEERTKAAEAVPVPEGKTDV